jgi:enterochelin esterase family protein
MLNGRSFFRNCLAGAVLTAAFAVPGRFVSGRAQAPAPSPAAPSTAPAGRGGGPQVPAFVSPEVLPDKRVVFRLLGPQATEVAVQGVGRGREPMVKGENGIWEATLGPVTPGAYQYTFVVHGVQVPDPRNQATNETTTGYASLLVVPGSEMTDTANVPHGALAKVYYDSSVLGRQRRMHVYTPPGYGANGDRYPVFYLLHGSGDSDQSWSALGRAGIILDNLIAARKAKPMVVVMPAGHTAVPATPASREQFIQEFLTEIMPFVEKHYRVRTDRASRAIAGLSMGGGQTLSISVPNLDKFGYIGVFSAGLAGGGAGRGAAPGPAAPYGESWEKQHQARLDDAGLKKGLKVLWFGIGKEDQGLANGTNTVALFKKHGFNPVFHQSEGGHTWPNWRDYLVIFAPQLF